MYTLTKGSIIIILSTKNFHVETFFEQYALHARRQWRENAKTCHIPVSKFI